MTQEGTGRNRQTLKARWWSFFYRRCLVGFPWFWPGRPPRGVPAMVAARRVARQHFGRDQHPLYRALAQVLTTIAWPPAALIHLWQIRRLLGPEAVPIKRVPGALWAAVRHNILPCDYYACALWQPDRRANIDNYLYANESVHLFKALNRPSQPDPIRDKLAFHELCKANLLPTPSVLAAFAPTGKLLEFEAGRPPEEDLFVKPRHGYGGDGTERFRWHQAGFEKDCGYRLSPQDLETYLSTRARSEDRTLLVQPLLSNHPELCIQLNGALAIVRLITGRSIDGDVIPIFGFAYFSVDEGWQVEGLIDASSGRLMSTPLRNRSGTMHWHCRRGSDDLCMMPEWDAALRYAKTAHQSCAHVVFIGWDIAFTSHGPMLLEGNVNWSPDAFQSLSGEPLGHTKFADVLATHLIKSGRSSKSIISAPSFGRKI